MLRPDSGALRAAADAAVADEELGEASGAQPRLERRGRHIVLAGVADEWDGHWLSGGMSSPYYSMTSSASASSVAGTVRPSALAVLRLIKNSNLVAWSTGRSVGFSPLRIRPT